MIDPAGYIIGGASIAALALLFRFAHLLENGNIEKENENNGNIN